MKKLKKLTLTEFAKGSINQILSAQNLNELKGGYISSPIK
ncbi:MAG: TIGR04149 family rSAM-modified RiPP [Bacteroidetes bacterium]|nr:TIGR04149 family rSAM-modified RiPP [Bacteroidota bacterium]